MLSLRSDSLTRLVGLQAGGEAVSARRGTGRTPLWADPALAPLSSRTQVGRESCAFCSSRRIDSSVARLLLLSTLAHITSARLGGLGCCALPLALAGSRTAYSRSRFVRLMRRSESFRGRSVGEDGTSAESARKSKFALLIDSLELRNLDYVS